MKINFSNVKQHGFWIWATFATLGCAIYSYFYPTETAKAFKWLKAQFGKAGAKVSNATNNTAAAVVWAFGRTIMAWDNFKSHFKAWFLAALVIGAGFSLWGILAGSFAWTTLGLVAVAIMAFIPLLYLTIVVAVLGLAFGKVSKKLNGLLTPLGLIPRVLSVVAIAYLILPIGGKLAGILFILLLYFITNAIGNPDANVKKWNRILAMILFVILIPYLFFYEMSETGKNAVDSVGKDINTAAKNRNSEADVRTAEGASSRKVNEFEVQMHQQVAFMQVVHYQDMQLVTDSGVGRNVYIHAGAPTQIVLSKGTNLKNGFTYVWVVEDRNGVAGEEGWGSMSLLKDRKDPVSPKPAAGGGIAGASRVDMRATFTQNYRLNWTINIGDEVYYKNTSSYDVKMSGGAWFHSGTDRKYPRTSMRSVISPLDFDCPSNVNIYAICLDKGSYHRFEFYFSNP